jgi:hypothetical protein
VRAERRDPASLLNRLERMIRTPKNTQNLPVENIVFWNRIGRTPFLLMHARTRKETPSLRFTISLASPSRPRFDFGTDKLNHAVFFFGGKDDATVVKKDLSLELNGYAYNWLRLKSREVALGKNRRSIFVLPFKKKIHSCFSDYLGRLNALGSTTLTPNHSFCRELAIGKSMSKEKGL